MMLYSARLSFEVFRDVRTMDGREPEHRMCVPEKPQKIISQNIIFKKNVTLFLAFFMIGVFFYLHAYVAPLIGEETHYATVAWQMFSEHNWFIPMHGGKAYLDKTPLLYWCLNLGWWIKINWPWEVILPAAFAMLTVYYTQKLSAALFQSQSELVTFLPLVLISMPFFVNNLALLRFDMLLTLFNVLACYCLTQIKNSRKFYWGFVLANGLGLLAKGPVIYVFTMPETLLFCLYFNDKSLKDILKLFGGMLLSLNILMVWWGPMIYQGQSHLIHQLFFEQVLSRATGANGPTKPFWDYLSILPGFFLPWILFVPFLRVKKTSIEKDKAARYLVCTFIICFILFSMIRTKEARYLLPLTPLVAIYIAYRLQTIFSSQYRSISLSIIGILLCCCALSLFFLLNDYPEKISIFYAHYFPNIALYIFFAIGCVMMIGRCLSLKKQIILLMLSSIFVSMTLDLATTSAIAKTQDLTPSVQFINQLYAKHLPVVSRNSVVLNMRFLGRWSKDIPIISSNKKFELWVETHSTGWVITVSQKETPEAYAVMMDGCFKQTFMHLRNELQICPVSIQSS